MPALLKGFLDRALMPGFAFIDRDDGEGYEALLTDRTGQLLTTMDTPPWVYRWIYKAPGVNALAHATLGFCGVKPVRVRVFGPVKDALPALRRQWIAAARAEGERLSEGVLDRGARRRARLLAWIGALRLQFYPMTWAAYGLGALGAVRSGVPFQAGAFWLGLLCAVSLEAATVFANEYFDFDSDRRNRHFGPFTGGSRVLVDGRLGTRELGLGILVALAIFAAAAGALAATAPPGAVPLPLLGGLCVLALGYTVPPLKLCWRGLGEIDVGLTHSLAAVLCGYNFIGGAWNTPFPYLVSLPLFWAVLPSITLSAIPDYDADAAAGKRTLAVRLGPRGAIRVAQGATVLAVLTLFAWGGRVAAGWPLAAVALVILAHAARLVVRLERQLRRERLTGRIDGLMALSLTYVLWFVTVPLVALWLR
jgi:1,4-dihydroxy-2-naphthoate octaprenyltransferase